MLKGQEVTVVGGGIGGLTAALALARRGAQVRVLEQAPEIAEVGAGLQISPNGMVVLDALGVGEPARAQSLRSHAVDLKDGLTGKSVVRMDLDRLAPDQAFQLFHRADLQMMLADAAQAAGVRLETGRKVVNVAPDASGVDITFADGQTERTPFLVGADGLHSVLRPVLNMPAKPFFTGQVAWRAIVPSDGQAVPEAQVFMGPGRHLVVYPLRDGKILNIVAVEERDSWADEGWFHADDPGNLRMSFKAFCPEVKALLERVDQVYLWGLHRHSVAIEWHRGRSALLGDAAHPTLPFMAQGAVMAIEDAWVLAASLAELGLDDGPALYQARRRHRVARVIDAANKNARNYHHANPLVRGAGFGAMRLANTLAPTRLFQRFDWIYGFDVTRAS